MAGLSRLKLSALQNDLTYPMNSNAPNGRCLIHVKLTDFCVKTIETLMDSEKGAFFSLVFDENGGKMSIPVDRGDPKIFKFKTAPLEGEGQGSLECVHQEMTEPAADHSLSCWGMMEHRLTVQGTEEVYARTKIQMKEVAERRKEQRPQEVKVVPQAGRATKVKSYSVEKVSPMAAVTMRKHNRSRAPVTGSSKFPSLTGAGRSVPHSKPHQPPAARIGNITIATTTTPSSTTPTAHVSGATPTPPTHKPGGRNTYSLKQRVIHILAIKPQNRETMVTKLKKATKRSETAMTNLDSILEEVSEVSQGVYTLKSVYFNSVDVDQWPFYTDVQRQMLKRVIQTKNYTSEVSSSTAVKEEPVSVGYKRSNSEQDGGSGIKKPKVTEPSSPSYPSPPSVGVAIVDFMGSNSDGDSPGIVPSSSDVLGGSQYWEPTSVRGDSNNGQNKGDEDSLCSSPSKKHKKKKKKKKKEEESDMTSSGPTSTSSIPEYLSQFPPLSTYEERQRYKQTFNKEYIEYLQLKADIDEVSSNYRAMCSRLSERLNSVPKHSEEYMETKRSIQQTYKEYHCNKAYRSNKSRFDELHLKLSHIKQMVLDYDSQFT